MQFEFIDVIEVEPVLESCLNEVLRFGIDLAVRQIDVEGVDDALRHEREPSSVAGEVGEELLFVAGSAEVCESYSSLLGVAVCRPLGDVGGSDDGFHDVQFFGGHSVNLVESDESVFGNT